MRIAASVLRKPQGFTRRAKKLCFDSKFMLLKNLTLLPHRQ
jgi:hypothetical protein